MHDYSLKPATFARWYRYHNLARCTRYVHSLPYATSAMANVEQPTPMSPVPEEENSPHEHSGENFTEDEAETVDNPGPEPDTKRQRQLPTPSTTMPDSAYTTGKAGNESDFPDELWALITHEVKLREKDEVILEMCRKLHDMGISYPEMLEQAPPALITQIFPLDTHARHHVGVLHVQAMLKRKSESMYNVAAQATNRLANEQAKSRKAKKNKGFTDSEGEDEMTRKPFNATAAMKAYRMDTIPSEHMPDFDTQNAYAKRAQVGVKERGNYVVPGPVTTFNPKWLKNGPKGLDELQTHAHWVAAYWGKALTQVACQGHVGRQTLSMPDMLTEFLNANKAIIENSNRTGWYVDNVKWEEASDRYRRMDTTFDVHSHFQQITTTELEKARTHIDADKAKSKGKGKGGKTKEARTKQWQSATTTKTQYANPTPYSNASPQMPTFIPTPPPTHQQPTQYGKAQGKRNRDGQYKQSASQKGAGKKHSGKK